jgi:excinuclease UvrABC nuclease subunit
MRCAVYRHQDADGKTIYVGQSENPDERNKHHRSQSPWWPDVCSVDVTWYKEREEAVLAEAFAIFLERPKFNKGIPRRLLANKLFPTVSVKSYRATTKEKVKRERFAVQVLLTASEADEIREAAKSEGFKVGHFMRYAAIRMARTRTQ